MKKLFLFFALLLSVHFAYGQTATFPTRGDGSAGAPYQIETVENLYWLTQTDSVWGRAFVQTDDIDAAILKSWGYRPIGSDTVPFMGVYDGGKYFIENLYVVNGHTNGYRGDYYTGLFGFADSAELSNVGLINIEISVDGELSGALAGAAFNSTIEFCYATGVVDAKRYAGGLVGRFLNSTISNSYSSVSVLGAEAYSGALLGSCNECVVENSFGSGYVNNHTLLDRGGLIGDSWGGAVNNSYWNVENSGVAKDSIGEGKTTLEMKRVLTYSGWNFESNTWKIREEKSYPYFLWQNVVINSGSPDGYSVEEVSITTGNIYNNLNTDLTDVEYGYEIREVNDVSWSAAITKIIEPSATVTAQSDLEIPAILLTGLNNSTEYYYRSYMKYGTTVRYGSLVYCHTGLQLPGEGTEIDPYEIRTYDDLKLVSEASFHWDKYYTQKANIPAQISRSNVFNPIGNEVTQFSGEYNGNNYTIDSLYIPSGYRRAMFGTTYNAVIKNLGLTNIDIHGFYLIGGLIGEGYSTSISNSFVTGSITGTQHVGGLIGRLDNSEVIDCYSTASVRGDWGTGGFIGVVNNSTVERSYSSGMVEGRYVGGLIGDNQKGTIINSFWDIETSGVMISNGGVGKSNAEIMLQATFVDWDFTYSFWRINEERSRPYFVWQDVIVQNSIPKQIEEDTVVMPLANIWNNTSVEITNIEYGYMYKAGNSPSWEDCTKEVVASGGSISAKDNKEIAETTISSLSLKTLYYIKAYATDGTNVWYGNEVRFRTKLPLNGYGTELSPYEVSNLDDLKILSEGSGYWDKQYLQVADIDALDTKTWNSNEGFISIGTNTIKFDGIYDGGGYSIDNLYINRSGVEAGLFGIISSATIKNINIIQCNVTGGYYVGALAGYSNESVLQNITVSGIVTGENNNVGGVLGYSTRDTISFNSNNSHVAGRSSVGGIIGYGMDTHIANSYNTGGVSGEEVVGGIIGYSSVSTISNSYNSAGIVGGSKSGALIGYGDKTITNSFWDQYTSNHTTSSGGNPLASDLLKNESTFSAWDMANTVWSIVENSTRPYFSSQNMIVDIDYPVVIDEDFATLPEGAIYNNSGSDLENIEYGYLYKINDTPIWTDSEKHVIATGVKLSSGSSISVAQVDLTGLTVVTPYFVRCYVKTSDSLWFSNELFVMTRPPFEGKGTKIDPYKIATLEDLRIVSEQSLLWNKHFVQIADIDASTTNTWNSTTGFNPIGNNQIPFAGNYNGGGFEIDGLFINDDTRNYVGFFGRTLNATINNVGLTNINITGAGSVGGLIGFNELTNVENCKSLGVVVGGGNVGGLIGSVSAEYNKKVNIYSSYSSGSVSGINSIGGLVGNIKRVHIINSHSSSNVSGDNAIGGLVGSIEAEPWEAYWVNTIANSYAEGVITGTDYVGGFVGSLKATSIENSYSIGNVTGESFVGGFVGEAHSYTFIENSYSNGDVSGIDNVGGLIATIGIESTVSKCYSSGRVVGTTTIGGLIGSNALGLAVENSFWAIDSSGVAMSAGGTGKAATVMYQVHTFTDLDSNGLDSAWDFTGNSNDDMGSVNLWYINEGNDYPQHAHLLNYPRGEHSAVSGETLQGVISGEAGTPVVAIADYGYAFVEWSDGVTDNPRTDVNIQNGLTVSPVVELSDISSFKPRGEGTKDTPYEIENLDNLIWVSATDSVFDKYFIQTAHIDASDTKIWASDNGFYPIGNLSNSFTGNYNGNNHVIYELYINREKSNSIGLFGYVVDGEIYNLGVTEIEVYGDLDVGGLVGRIDNGSVKNSYAIGSIRGTDGVGGLIGFNGQGGIGNSYSGGDVSGNNITGGLIGVSLGDVANSYSTSKVTSISAQQGRDIGGVLGGSFGGINENLFWDKELSTVEVSMGGTGKSTNEMKMLNTFTMLSSEGLSSPWDFTGRPNDDTSSVDIWYMINGTTYPLFKAMSQELNYSSGAHGTVTGQLNQLVASGMHGKEVVAVAENNYHFVQWSDGVTTEVRRDSIVLNDTTIIAEFAEDAFTVTYVADGNGTFSGDSVQIVLYEKDGTEVTVLADSGYHFVGWSDTVTSETRFEKEVTTDTIITAFYEINKYSVEYSSGLHGSLQGAASQEVSHGSAGDAIFVAPQAGYRFVGWSDSLTDNPRIDINIIDDIEVEAEFTVNTFSLVYTTDGNGLINGSASQIVGYNTQGSEVTAVANTGYHFVEWSDGVSAYTRIDLDIRSEVNVEAQFAIDTFNVNYTTDGNGTISGEVNQVVNFGFSGSSVIAVANAGYHFLKWSDDTIENPRQDSVVIVGMEPVALFSLNTYTVEYIPEEGGSISGETLQDINYGVNGIMVTAVPFSNYRFIQWSDGQLSTTRQEINVIEAKTISAQFELIDVLIGVSSESSNISSSTKLQNLGPTDPGGLSSNAVIPTGAFQLTYSAGANGTMVGGAIQIVESGLSGVAVTVVPNAGFVFAEWSDGSIENPRIDSNVTIGVSVTAVYQTTSPILVDKSNVGEMMVIVEPNFAIEFFVGLENPHTVVTVSIYDCLGKNVASLSASEYFDGMYKLTWYLDNRSAGYLLPGTYIAVATMKNDNVIQHRSRMFKIMR